MKTSGLTTARLHALSCAMPDSRIPPIAYPILLIACLCIYGIILDPGMTFAGMDFVNLNFPRASLVKEALLSGALPLWNWYEWGGAPLLAALQGAVFYPPTWLALLCPLPYGLQLFVFFHIYAAGVGACLLAKRHLKLPSWACVLCGIVYMGNDFFPGRIEQFQIVAVNCLLPWLILAMGRAVTFQQGGLIATAAVWSMTLVAGHPQYAAMNLIGTIGFLGLNALLIRRKKSAPSAAHVSLKQAGSLLGGLILGSLVAAVQLMPTWELGQLSERIWPYPEPTVPELSWVHLPALLIPRYYNLVTGETGRVFGFTELGLYGGMLTVPLALWSLVVLRKQNPRVTSSLSAIAIVWVCAMIFALGRNGLLAPLIFEYVPFFKQTRGAARSLNVAALMLALLTGAGASGLVALLRNKLKQPVLAGSILCALYGLDLSVNHWNALGSILAPARVLAIKPLVQKQSLVKESYNTRLYRFMSFDSDLYLNNAPPALAERIYRYQPNLGSLLHMPVVDGYEEGLLPTRTRANLYRRFNRNLRNDVPDAPLLAMLGSNIMLTEFPLPPSRTWTPVANPVERPAIVPDLMGEPTSYHFLKSAYAIRSLALDTAKLGISGHALDEAVLLFPDLENERVPSGQAWVKHPFEQLTADNFLGAQLQGTPATSKWNQFSFKAGENTSEVLVLMSPYPGWKISQKNSGAATLKSLSSLFYKVGLGTGPERPMPVNLVFSPFSVRFGLFISLISLMFFALCVFSLMRRDKRTLTEVGFDDAEL